ncbi:hypothetical protein SCHPADRAFT_943631 [Schizopora paradoxa]|uniref:Uncharacterized protein n=1 Tax=Schizopora paradoxa TaxID=27342 RepID=A0A0H2RC94_9AGAM|nr:hypothetical protein SCHPADRAFT_943631 [Schizopora paradoxa]
MATTAPVRKLYTINEEVIKMLSLGLRLGKITTEVTIVGFPALLVVVYTWVNVAVKEVTVLALHYAFNELRSNRAHVTIVLRDAIPIVLLVRLGEDEVNDVEEVLDVEEEDVDEIDEVELVVLVVELEVEDVEEDVVVVVVDEVEEVDESEVEDDVELLSDVDDDESEVLELVEYIVGNTVGIETVLSPNVTEKLGLDVGSSPMEIPMLIDVGNAKLIEDGVDRLDGVSISDAEVRGGEGEEAAEEEAEEPKVEEEKLDEGGVEEGDEEGRLDERVVGADVVKGGSEVGEVGGGVEEVVEIDEVVREDVVSEDVVVVGSRDMVVVVVGKRGRGGTSSVGVGVDDGACLRDKAFDVVAWARERVDASEESSTRPTRAKEAERRVEVLDPTTGGVTSGPRIIVNEENEGDRLRVLHAVWTSVLSTTEFPRADGAGGVVGRGRRAPERPRSK